MIDINELRALTQAVNGWSNCNHAWLDTSEDVAAAVVGHIDESGETYPVATIDCDQYFAAHQSLPLAKFYAAANPAAVLELLDRLEAAEKERDALREKIACMERQKPVAQVGVHKTGGNAGIAWSARPLNEFDSLPLLRDGDKLYALPGAKGE